MPDGADGGYGGEGVRLLFSNINVLPSDVPLYPSFNPTIGDRLLCGEGVSKTRCAAGVLGAFGG